MANNATHSRATTTTYSKIKWTNKINDIRYLIKDAKKIYEEIINNNNSDYYSQLRLLDLYPSIKDLKEMNSINPSSRGKRKQKSDKNNTISLEM